MTTMTKPKLRVLSLGAGVQSTAMALMAAHGEFDVMPDCAIFADTGWEPAAVYSHLAWLMSGNVLPFPVYVVSAGNIREELLGRGSRRASNFIGIPAHLKFSNGDRTIGKRQCTNHYKIEPLRRKVRELLGKQTGFIAPGSVEKWLGISVDEVFRATPARVKFEVNRFPLLEARKSRGDCLEWLKRHGYPEPPKSACIGCPLHSDPQWREVRARSPEEFADAVYVDAQIRAPIERTGRASAGTQFLHPKCKPLDQVDLSTAEDHGQLNLFNLECEGMCGL